MFKESGSVVNNKTASIAWQWESLERVMAIAQFDPHGTLRHANDNFLSLFGYTQNSVAGWHHSRFCAPPFTETPDYPAFWSGLCGGSPYTGLAVCLHKDGHIISLLATYIPVLDDRGHVKQIMKIVHDVSKYLESDDKERLCRLALVADYTDTAVMISDGQWRIVDVNQGFMNMFGWNADEVAGHSPIALLSSQLDKDVVEDIHKVLLSGNPFEREEILVGKQGQRYWAKVVCNPVMGIDGSLLYTVSTLTDITRAKMHEVLQHQTLEALVQERPLTNVLNLICREVERIAPEVAATILAVDSSGKLHPLAGPSLPLSYAQSLDGMQSGEKAVSCGTAVWRNEPVMVDDIATSPLWDDYRHLIIPLGYTGCWSTPVRNNHGQVIATFALYFHHYSATAASEFHQRLIEACTDLCALALLREQERQSIRQLAFYDSLTGLPNRSLLGQKTDKAINAAMEREEHMAVLFIDLDRFKKINDSLGHPAGDELLRQVADVLRRELCAIDICGRLSGDEFAVILPQCTVEQVRERVECLQAALTAPRLLLGTTVSITASVGIAMFPANGRDMETLLRRADMAMYQAKSNAVGHYKFFSADMDEQVHERLALENALRLALKKNQLTLHYQPQVELTSGHIYGVEALARWTHSVMGEIPPSRFIPLAEECGLIAELGCWALSEACFQLAAWRTAGLSVPAVSVNLSPTSFHNVELPLIIAATLDKHGLRPEDLTVELTESVLLDTNPNTMKTVAEVHALGVRLSMDDFGTGYSSLSYLRRLPVSELKLDRSFVADLEMDSTACSLSRAILGIGASLNLTVVAEGVETAEQKRFLREQGYPVAQGYLFTKPMSPEKIEDWLRNRYEFPNNRCKVYD